MKLRAGEAARLKPVHLQLYTVYGYKITWTCNSPLCRALRRGSCGETTPCFVLQRLLRPNGQIRYLGPELTHVITYKAYNLIVSVVLCAYRSCGAIARAIATATQRLAATRYTPLAQA